MEFFPSLRRLRSSSTHLRYSSLYSIAASLILLFNIVEFISFRTDAQHRIQLGVPMKHDVQKLCEAILAFDKLVHAEILRHENGEECGGEEGKIIDSLISYLGEDIPLSVEKEDYIFETYILSADVRRIVADNDMGMVSLGELLEIQRHRFLGKKKRSQP